MRLLFVEDDPHLASAVTRNLEASGFAVDHVSTRADAEACTGAARYDVMVLDLGLPDGDGLELLRRLRHRRDPLPVLVLTARDAVADRVAGLEAGADDYLVKPFAHEELVARLRALLRRPREDLGDAVRVGNLTYQPSAGTFTVGDGRPLVLPRREQMLLATLMRRAGGVVTRGVLEEAIWDFAQEIESNALESHVSRLRRHLQEAGAGVEIRSIRGVGYLLRAATS
ncbi:MAG TPA: response regulator transcription factor [Rhodospirillales bacterium]|nr:response regulator transcription factor [Rhodospirillales bacterium]